MSNLSKIRKAVCQHASEWRTEITEHQGSLAFGVRDGKVTMSVETGSGLVMIPLSSEQAKWAARQLLDRAIALDLPPGSAPTDRSEGE